MPKLVRITTVPISLKYLLRGQMAFMKQNGFEVIAISSSGIEIKDIVQTEGCTHFVIPFTRKISPLQDLWCLIKLIILLKKIKPDIVHTHTPKAGLIGMWAAYCCSIPIRLHTIAGLPWLVENGLKKIMLKNIERLTIFFSNKTFVNANSLLVILNNEKVISEKLSIIANGTSNGIDCNYYKPTKTILEEAAILRKESGAEADTYIWIFIGRLVKDKGIEELIKAFTALVAKYPDNQLWLVGDEEPLLDPLSDNCKSMMQQNTKVKQWGFRNDVRSFLVASNTLVFPSYREGFPNVPMQAALMNCNLILSDINGCNEIVEHNRTGLLVKPADSNDLLDKMMFAYNNDLLMRAYSQIAKAEIINKYDQKQLWKSILEEYEQQLTTIHLQNHLANIS